MARRRRLGGVVADTSVDSRGTDVPPAAAGAKHTRIAASDNTRSERRPANHVKL
jgi:hypothetical protein